MVGKETAVDPGDEILGHVHEGDVAAWHADPGDRNPAEEDPVANEAAGEGDPFGGGALVPEIEETDDEVADADPLQHAVEAHVNEMEVGEAVDDDAEEDEDDGADDGVPGELSARCALGEARVEG